MPSRPSLRRGEAGGRAPAGRAAPRSPQQLGLLWDMPAHGLVAGVDEAGRGPLAGPVVAAAVILDEQQPIEGLGDSKQLSERRREALFDEIRAKALCVCMAQAEAAEIDDINILQATLLAMRRAVMGLRLRPTLVLIDGNRLPVLPMQAQAIVQGDARVDAIAAASILAKVHRDRLLQDLDVRYPVYGFAQHKGYPTATHLQALRVHGPCAAHRRSFAPVRDSQDASAYAPGTASGSVQPAPVRQGKAP